MDFIKLVLYSHGIYMVESFSHDTICSLGEFFSDLGCPGTSLDDWIFDDNKGLLTSGNSARLEKDNSNIYIDSLYDEKGYVCHTEDMTNKLIISRKNLACLINDWKEKVCKKSPQKVTITQEGDIFSLTTSD